jgi:hypothetical protein
LEGEWNKKKGGGQKHGKVCQKNIHHVVTFTIMT